MNSANFVGYTSLNHKIHICLHVDIQSNLIHPYLQCDVFYDTVPDVLIRITFNIFIQIKNIVVHRSREANKRSSENSVRGCRIKFIYTFDMKLLMILHLPYLLILIDETARLDDQYLRYDTIWFTVLALGNSVHYYHN